MKKIICFLFLTSFVINSNARKIKAAQIKDPIDSSFKCNSNNVYWDGEKLASKTNGVIYCESTGYTAFINKEDVLTEKERKSIKKFLKKTKKYLGVKKFDFSTMSMIDYLWLTKNIYARRDLSPSQHIQVMEELKMLSEGLTVQLIVEKEELLKYCKNKIFSEAWCRVFTLKNKLWEEYQMDKMNNN